jgi:hypothetical protein
MVGPIDFVSDRDSIRTLEGCPLKGGPRCHLGLKCLINGGTGCHHSSLSGSDLSLILVILNIQILIILLFISMEQVIKIMIWVIF